MSTYAYVGTYTHPAGHGEGIYVYKIDGQKWTLVQTVSCVCPSFFSFNQRKDRLYVANEFNDNPDQQGEVSAYAVDARTGKLSLLNSFSSLGVYPCHTILDANEKYVLVSNYLTGSVVIFELESNGALKPNPELLVLEGTTGPNKPRQERPHAHMVFFDVNQVGGSTQRALVVDLGVDKTLFYDFDSARGKLIAPKLSEPPLVAHAGSGPRHVAQSQDGRFYYVTNELDSTVSVFAGAVTNGERATLQVISAVPDEIVGKEISFCAELTLHPSGRFLYGSNRGHDSIVIYSVDVSTGLLTLVGFEPTQGHCPRHFLIDSAGEYMYVANQKSDNVVAFHIDSSTGKLSPTGLKVQITSPVCIILN